MAEPYDGLRDLRRERRAGDQCRLADRNEDLVARLVLPAVAHRQREFLADVVELPLREELHVRREIDDEVRRNEMNVDRPGRKVDGGIDISRPKLKQGIGPVIDLKIGQEIS